MLRGPGSFFTRCRAFLDTFTGAQVVQRCADQCWHRWASSVDTMTNPPELQLPLDHFVLHFLDWLRTCEACVQSTSSSCWRRCTGCATLCDLQVHRRFCNVQRWTLFSAATAVCALLLPLLLETPSGQRWHRWHASPFWQPCFFQNHAQGWQWPVPCMSEPTEAAEDRMVALPTRVVKPKWLRMMMMVVMMMKMGAPG